MTPDEPKTIVQEDVECVTCGLRGNRTFTLFPDGAEIDPCPRCGSYEGRFQATVRRADWHGKISGWTK